MPAIKIAAANGSGGVGTTIGLSIGERTTFSREIRPITPYRSAIDAGAP
jgi:hypothetical protein